MLAEIALGRLAWRTHPAVLMEFLHDRRHMSHDHGGASYSAADGHLIRCVSRMAVSPLTRFMLPRVCALLPLGGMARYVAGRDAAKRKAMRFLCRPWSHH